ncbi:MAG: FadR family transcriptional regulator [Deltaproteobacteria bacterium]|nr:FadR family transcriptional regulator [Deltaproteobacteria bacterium]
MSEPQGEVRRVANVVLRRILDGTYPSGLRMPTEAALAAELACGRSTVREALRHLADQGLLQSRRGSGAHVLDWRREGTPALLPEYVKLGRLDVPPVALVETMLRIRTMMACEAVRLAALHAPPEALAEAEALLERAPSLEGDPTEHALNELELYRALVRASGMWPAVWMVNALWAPLHELNRFFAPALGEVRRDFQPTMLALLARIRARDAKTAVRRAEAWFRDVDARLIVKLGPLFGEAGPKHPKVTAPRQASASPTKRASKRAEPRNAHPNSPRRGARP